MKPTQQPPSEIPKLDDHARIHPSLREFLLGIRLDKLLTPEELKQIFSSDVESVLRDLVRETRAKGLLP